MKHLPPINITHILNIFSLVVFALTFPNPTLVKLEQVKYKAVTYVSMLATSDLLILSLSARILIQPETKFEQWKREVAWKTWCIKNVAPNLKYQNKKKTRSIHKSCNFCIEQKTYIPPLLLSELNLMNVRQIINHRPNINQFTNGFQAETQNMN